MKADLLIDAQNTLGEGVQWNSDQRRVWWTDIHGCALWSCDADGGSVDMIQTKERLGCFAFDPQNRILAAFESGLYRWDIERDQIEQIAAFEPEHPTSRMNDGRCDRKGRFVAGGIDEDGLKPTSSVVCYDGNEMSTVMRDIRCTNSICFSPDGNWMYFADSPTRVIQRISYDTETGEMGAPETFHTVDSDGGVPDGSCVDAEGALWNARFGGGIVQRILPDGSDDLTVTVGVPQVTCACFGGDQLDRLYITTARENLNQSEIEVAPLSGGLFVCEPGFRGLPEDRFASVLFSG